MAFGTQDDTDEVMNEINMTPFVDVMLVLLIIFIITAPLFHQAVPFDLPQVSSTKLEEKPLVISVAIDSVGKVHVDGVAMDKTAMAAHFASIMTNGGQPEMHLRADRATRYDKVAEVLADAQRAGIVKIAFVTEQAR